jgi:hypothetical protein
MQVGVRAEEVEAKVEATAFEDMANLSMEADEGATAPDIVHADEGATAPDVILADEEGALVAVGRS